MSKQNKQPLLQRPAVVGVLASLLSIVVGLVLGFVLLVLLNPGAAAGGMRAMLATGFSSMDKLGKVLYQAAPLMMCGLSVGFAFKTGLFNIGASGQYTMGAFFSLLCAIQFQLPWYVCLLAGAVGGAIWGVFAGLFKAYFNFNEVITAIMFNWIGMNLVNFLIPNYVQEGKTSLVIAIGCTGGKHRSVTLARELYSRLSGNTKYGFRLEHRDAQKDRLVRIQEG